LLDVPDLREVEARGFWTGRRLGPFHLFSADFRKDFAWGTLSDDDIVELTASEMYPDGGRLFHLAESYHIGDPIQLIHKRKKRVDVEAVEVLVRDVEFRRCGWREKPNSIAYDVCGDLLLQKGCSGGPMVLKEDPTIVVGLHATSERNNKRRGYFSLIVPYSSPSRRAVNSVIRRVRGL
jgi:hypothetical protein